MADFLFKYVVDFTISFQKNGQKKQTNIQPAKFMK